MTVIKTEILKASEKINKIRKEDSLVFPIFSDLHASGKDEKFNLLCDTLAEITKEIQTDAVLDLGDNLGMLGRTIHISDADLEQLLTDMFSEMKEKINCPILFANGNHDAVGTDFFVSSFWNKIVKQKYGGENAVYDTEGSYYYVDFPKADTRLVVLTVPCDSDFEAEHPTPVWAFGEVQLKWLKEKALDVKGNVILVMHVPFYYHHYGEEDVLIEVWDGMKVRTSYIPDLCGRIFDREQALEILNAFSEKENTRLVACISGHTHKDELWLAGEQKGQHQNGLPCPQIVTTGACIPQDTHEKFGVSVDVAVWTPSENTLKFFRIGDGEDREI